MTAAILDGKALASQLREETAEKVARFVGEYQSAPCLAAVLVGDDPASEIYVRNKQRACERAGIPLTLRMQPGYDHSYYFIASFIGDHIAHHAALLR